MQSSGTQVTPVKAVVLAGLGIVASILLLWALGLHVPAMQASSLVPRPSIT